MGSASLREPVTVTLVPPVVVGFPTVTVALQSLPALAVWFGGQEMARFDPVAVTVTVNLHDSPVVADVVTTVVPTGKKQSLQWSVVTVPQTPSLAVGVKCTTAPGLFGSVGSVVLAGVTISSGQVRVHVPAPAPAATVAYAVEELS
jgi:hypothetical protein